MKVKVTMRYALTAMALAICSVQVTQPAIQKIKRVSKPDDGQTWKVSIYKWGADNKHAGLVSSSKFKKNTDGVLPSKLKFDFTGVNHNIVEYGPTGTEHKVLVKRFVPIKTLTATLQIAPDDIVFDQRIQEIADQPDPSTREKRLIRVILPSDSNNDNWTIVSGTDFITHGRSKTLAELKSVYRGNIILGEIHITASNDYNDKLLNIYTKTPLSIAVQKDGAPLKITVIKQNELDKILAQNFLEINTDGSISPAKGQRKRKNIDANLKAALELRALLREEWYLGDQHFFPDNMTSTESVKREIKRHPLPANIMETKYYQTILHSKSYGGAKEQLLNTMNQLQEKYSAFYEGKDGSNANAVTMLNAIRSAQEKYSKAEKDAMAPKPNPLWE